jgi:hypothetical protein
LPSRNQLWRALTTREADRSLNAVSPSSGGGYFDDTGQDL